MTEYQLLKVNEVAQLLRLTKKAVWYLIRRGELHATLLGREYRIKKSDVDKLLEPKAEYQSVRADTDTTQEPKAG